LSPSKLSYFGIEVTRRCNLRCPHCFTDAGGKAHPGPETGALADLIERLARVGARTIAFSGGEPLLRPDLEEVMRRGLAARVESFTMVSNGYFTELDRARQLREAGLRGVQISVDGVDARDHAAVRACSAIDFYRALRAIRIWQEVDVAVDVACIISPTNVARAGEMALLCEALRVRSLRYCSFVPTGRATTDPIAARFRVEPAQLDRFLELLRGINEQPDAPIGVLTDHGIGPWSTSGGFVCDAGESVAYISSEGNLYPCPGTIFDEFIVGNVFRQPLEELLGSPRMACVREIRRSELADPCRTCDHSECTGGCRGAAFATRGDVRAAPTYCNVRRRG